MFQVKMQGATQNMTVSLFIRISGKDGWVLRLFQRGHRIRDQVREDDRRDINGLNIEGLMQVFLKGGNYVSESLF